MEQQEIMML